MTEVVIRKSGNANIISLPKTLLEQLGAGVGDKLNVLFEDGKLVLKPQKVRRKTLEELLEGVNPEMFNTEEDRDWMSMRPVGEEIL